MPYTCHRLYSLLTELKQSLLPRAKQLVLLNTAEVKEESEDETQTTLTAQPGVNMKHVVIKNKALEKLEHNRAETFMMDALIDNLVDQKLLATGVKRKRKSTQMEEYSLSHKDLLVRQEIMAWSIGGQPIPLLTVSSPSQDKKRKWIVITARVHAGETVGSHKMEGVIRFLTSDAREAVYLRRKYEFKLVPILNPDGVQVGNF